MGSGTCARPAVDRHYAIHTMPLLDYHAPGSSDAATPASLVLAPIAGAAATLVSAVQCLDQEPFGTFSVGDAVIHVGSPVLAAGLWVYWCVVARRSRLSFAKVLPSLTWAALHLWFALWLGIGYFSEPWNR